MENNNHPGLIFHKSDIFSTIFFKEHVGFAKTEPIKTKDFDHGIYAERFEDGWYICDKSTNYRIYYGDKRLSINGIFKLIARKFLTYITEKEEFVSKEVRVIDGNIVKVMLNKYFTYETDKEYVTCEIKDISDKDLSKLYEFTKYSFKLNLNALRVKDIRFDKANLWQFTKN